MKTELHHVFLPASLMIDKHQSMDEVLMSSCDTLRHLVTAEEEELVGQVPIDEPTYLYLWHLHRLQNAKAVHYFYQEDDPKKDFKQREMILMLEEYVKNHQQYTLVLTGNPSYVFPAHPVLGALYAGDQINFVNGVYLIRRRPSSNVIHCESNEEGFYLLAADIKK